MNTRHGKRPATALSHKLLVTREPLHPRLLYLPDQLHPQRLLCRLHLLHMLRQVQLRHQGQLRHLGQLIHPGRRPSDI